LAFEDKNRETENSDHDFNDMIFTIHATPFSAIDITDLPTVDPYTDRDGDGVPDEYDEYPDDPEP